jgi:hypothetical protein
MHVIRHEHIGMDFAVMFGGRRFETFQVKPEVVLGKECGLSIESHAVGHHSADSEAASAPIPP